MKSDNNDKYKILVNKNNPLDQNYIPEDLVEYTEYNGEKINSNHKIMLEKNTMLAFFEMQKVAETFGYHIIVDSGYRSYNYQKTILQKFLQDRGEEAYNIVALPGTSEHQTGLAFDIALYKNGEYTDEFDETFPEIIWLYENCYKFGFILRYPKGREKETGYNYECWHFRYVGKDTAQYMHDNNILTLEEYHQIIQEQKLGTRNK